MTKYFIQFWIPHKGRAPTFGTTKCRTVDISEFQNFKYENNEIRIVQFFHF